MKLPRWPRLQWRGVFTHQFSAAEASLIWLVSFLLAGLVASLGIYGPALGVVGGALLQLVILTPGWRALGLRFRWQWPGRDPGLRQVLRLLIPNGLSVGVSYGYFVLDTAFATLAAESAALAADYNAWLLVGLLVALAFAVAT